MDRALFGNGLVPPRVIVEEELAKREVESATDKVLGEEVVGECAQAEDVRVLGEKKDVRGFGDDGKCFEIKPVSQGGWRCLTEKIYLELDLEAKGALWDRPLSSSAKASPVLLAVG